MPWTTPETFTAGQTLTAASMNIVSGNARMGRPVFTNEAARDAAITSPEEGMTAYLTAPTVPAATGGSTMIPTGITTVYNGSAWVCVTEVAALTTTGGTTTSGTLSPSLTGGGTNPSVTITTGTSALVTVSANVSVSTTSTTTIDVAVSGASTKSAGTYGNGIVLQTSLTGLAATYGRTILIYDSLTPGANTFTLNYSVNAGTATISTRSLVVKGIA